MLPLPPPQHLQISGQSYCVDGFIVQHQASSGSVTREQIELASSYSFEWDHVPQTVTVEAYNSLGSSTNNVNMRLERQPKRKWAGIIYTLTGPWSNHVMFQDSVASKQKHVEQCCLLK